MVAGVAGQHLQRADVLGEAGAAVADPGAQEGGADPLVEAHPAGDLADVGADLLADVGDLVDEGDLGRQEGVGGELDHLGAGDVGVEDLAAERLVERRDRGSGLLVAGVGADHDPVGVHEVRDRGALLEELGAGDVGQPGQVAADRLAGPGRDRALHDQHVVAVVGQLLDHRRGPGRGRRRRSRSAACRRRRRAAARRSSSSDISVVKVIRSALRRSSSSRPGSWIVVSPRESDSTFSAGCRGRSPGGPARRSRPRSPGPPSRPRSLHRLALLAHPLLPPLSSVSSSARSRRRTAPSRPSGRCSGSAAGHSRSSSCCRRGARRSA